MLQTSRMSLDVAACLAWLICDGIMRRMSNDQWALSNMLCWSLALGWHMYIPYNNSDSTRYSFGNRHMGPNSPEQCARLALWLMFLVTNQNPDGWNNSMPCSTFQDKCTAVKNCQLISWQRKHSRDHEQIGISITLDFWQRDDTTQSANVVPHDDHIYQARGTRVQVDLVNILNNISL